MSQAASLSPAEYAPVTHCSSCKAALGKDPHKRRKTTLCKSCHARAMSQSPEKRKKCSDAMKARLANPDYLALHTDRITRGIRVAMLKPEFADHRREMGRQCGLKHLGFNTYPAGSDARVLAGKRASETKMAWCPPDYRADHHHYVRTKLMLSSEAKELVRQQIAADIKAYHAGLLPQDQFMKVRSAIRYLSERVGK